MEELLTLSDQFLLTDRPVSVRKELCPTIFFKERSVGHKIFTLTPT